MKKTFTTTMPDKVGAFISASKIISGLGLNITRVSYNKAVDTHILFIEVDGDEKTLEKTSELLAQNGYIKATENAGKVVLIEFKLQDKPGTLVPVLELINEFNFNISYISSIADGKDYQNFRMGLFIENENDVSQFLTKATSLCELKIIDYDQSEKVLDNTIFYISFANRIAEKLNLDDKQKQRLIVNSNLVMQLCDSELNPSYKSFDYISRFAENMIAFKGVKFKARTSFKRFGKIEILLIEPPCGSNVAVIKSNNRYIVVDSGFRCYKDETIKIISSFFSEFLNKDKILFLTHVDVDHVGFTEIFDKVFINQKCFDNFKCEIEKRDSFREENPQHRPYVKISKILSSYTPPNMDNLVVYGGNSYPIDQLFERVATLENYGVKFEIYEGKGGHVKGETLLIDRENFVAFTGDVYINVNNCTFEQAKFNKLALYLMSSVDTDAKLAQQERAEIFKILGAGKWTIYGGHGAAMEIGIN